MTAAKEVHMAKDSLEELRRRYARESREFDREFAEYIRDRAYRATHPEPVQYCILLASGNVFRCERWGKMLLIKFGRGVATPKYDHRFILLPKGFCHIS